MTLCESSCSIPTCDESTRPLLLAHMRRHWCAPPRNRSRMQLVGGLRLVAKVMGGDVCLVLSIDQCPVVCEKVVEHYVLKSVMCTVYVRGCEGLRCVSFSYRVRHPVQQFSRRAWKVGRILFCRAQQSVVHLCQGHCICERGGERKICIGRIPARNWRLSVRSKPNTQRQRKAAQHAQGQQLSVRELLDSGCVVGSATEVLHLSTWA